jgi:hypothetical protein
MAFLQIYDSTDASIVSTVNARGNAGGRVLAPCTSATDMINALNGFVSGGQTFDRILFETHGSPGRIYFNGVSITASWVTASLNGRNYESLCPNSTRIYFNGCNVAAESSGSGFLRATGSVFLKRSGGTVFGHTSLGLVVPIYSDVTGHVVHLTGDLKTVYFAAGGTVTEERTDSDI